MGSNFHFETVGFIGLGAMGKPMARNLIEKLPTGSRIYLFDVVATGVHELCESHPKKCCQCSSPQEVAEKSVSCEIRRTLNKGNDDTDNGCSQQNVVITMLPEGEHVRSVYIGSPYAISSTNLSGKLLIDCSTIDTASSLQVRKHVGEKYPTAAFYDAPVSGGVVGASDGTLAIFLGCDEHDGNLSKLNGVLSLMGRNIIPCGAPSRGLVAKIANNYLSGIIGIAATEAMDMGIRAGLNPRILKRVIDAGAAQNYLCERSNPVPRLNPDAAASKGYKPDFKVELMRKDMVLAVEMSSRVGCQNVLGEVSVKTYDGACNDSRCKGLDSKVIFRYLGGNEDWEKDFPRGD